MKKKKRIYRFVRRIARVFLVLVLLFVGVVLFVRSPWGQDLIVSRIVKALSDKTNTTISIDRLFLTFSGNVFLEGLYMEDQKGDTLVYSRALEANLSLSPLLFANKLDLRSVEWEGLTARINRKADSEKYNFNFLIEALAPQDTATVPQPGAPMQINIGSLNFKDFRIKYLDRYMGMEGDLYLGVLHLDANKTDLEKMRFELNDLELQDTEIVYKQTKPFIAKDTTGTLLPYFEIDDLRFTNVRAEYNSIPDNVLAAVDIGNFLLELPRADLSANDISIGILSLRDSHIYVKTVNGDTQTAVSIPEVENAPGFKWPDFLIEAEKLSLQNNSVTYISGNSTGNTTQFNPDAVSVSGLALQASNLAYEPGNAHLKISEFHFREKSGFQLKNFAFEADLEDTSTTISGLNLETEDSSLRGELTLNYQSLQKFMDSPAETAVELQLTDITLALHEAFIFQPDLSKDTYLKKAAEYPVTGSLSAEGTLANILIDEMELNWGKNTSLTARGRLNHVMRPPSLSFSMNTIRVNSTRTDLLEFISEKDLGVSLPQTVSVQAEAKGSLDDMHAEGILQIPEGTVRVSGNYYSRDRIQFEGNVEVDSLRLDQLLNNKQIGGISFTMAISGSGKNMHTLNARLDSDFSQLEVNNYDFSNLSLQGEMVNGEGAIRLKLKDENLDFTANTKIDIDSIASDIDLDVNVIGVDLYALGITRERIKAGLKMKAHFAGNTRNYTLRADLTEGIAVYENEQYQMGDIHLTSRIDTLSTEIVVDSELLAGRLRSNTSPQGVRSSVIQQFRNYFSDGMDAQSSQDSVRLDMELKLRPTPVISEVFLRGLQRLDSISVRADFDAYAKKLRAELSIPLAVYEGSSIDSLNVLVQGDSINLNFTAGFAGLAAKPVNIKRTFLTGNLKNKELYLDFSSFDEDENLVHVAAEMTLARDTILLHVDPDKLVFNKKEWTIPQDNRISIAEKFLDFRNVKLSRNDQELTVSTAVPDIERKHVGITFNNFMLQTFMSLLNPDEALAAGLVKGRLIIENPFEATGIVADFDINNLAVMQNPLGNLSLEGASKRSNEYDFNLALKDGGADLDILGDYTAAETGALLNLDMVLNKIELKAMEGFANGAIKDSKGSFSGNVNVTGTTVSPKYDGSLNFNGVEFNVAALNSVFRIADETIQIDTEKLSLDNFQIADPDGNTFTLDGSFGTAELLNPSFDLKLNADKFRLLNSTEEDNELFYGTASLDADVTVKGDLELPEIDGKLRIRKVTDMTYVVPESQLDVEERDGVVIFVNREDPDAILTRNDQEETPSLLGGMDLSAILEIADDAVFNIIIDENTGDNLQVSGDGSLNLNIEPNGRITLSGRYELNSGHYETSLYNLVKRRFEINPGSTITWQGDPMDAKLDVTAVYKVETSAAPLMSAVTSGQDVSIAGKYRQVLPFLVYLNVDGELLEPKLSFDLDMPEDEQGSLGGSVYGRVQQLNSQEAELNKQVFSLLALNRFFPDSGSDGSAGGTAALARDNVNKVLSGELNAFSDKVFGKSGFELDFDLDSFTDYQGENPQDRTQLNINARKKLFDDRLIVTAGSAVDVEGSAQPGQEETPIIGNVSLEYLLTKNGRYRLRGFRKNEYENIIDGQLIVTGVALIFNREFNRFSELFNPLAENETQGSPSGNDDKQKTVKTKED